MPHRGKVPGNRNPRGRARVADTDGCRSPHINELPMVIESHEEEIPPLIAVTFRSTCDVPRNRWDKIPHPFIGNIDVDIVDGPLGTIRMCGQPAGNLKRNTAFTENARDPPQGLPQKIAPHCADDTTSLRWQAIVACGILRQEHWSFAGVV